MKKFAVLALSMFCFNAMADNSNANTATNTQQAQPPVAAIRVIDSSVKPEKLMEGNSLSRAKARKLCMVIENVNVLDNNQVAIYVQAPAAITFAGIQGKIQSEDNQKNHLIVFNVAKKEIKNNQFAQCWTFGKEDPVGEYKVDLQFNDIVFKGLSFNLLK